MKSIKSLQRFAFTFAVILLLQEFSAARYVNRPRRLKEKIEEREKRELIVDSYTEDDETALETQSQSRKRRSLAGILLGVAVFVSLANVAFDIYLQIEGCCGLYSDACDYKDKFEAAQTNIENTQETTDALWVVAEQKYNWILNSNNKNVEIWTEVKRIMELSDTIVEVLDPDVVDALIEKNAEIKGYVEDGNQTVLSWTYAEVSAEYTSLFDTTLGTLQHLSGLIGNVAEIILGQVYGWYKKAQIRNMLRTDYGSELTQVDDKLLRTLGATDVDNLVDQTATSRYNYDVATTRGHRIMNFASGVMSLVQIGVEIFIAILKVQQCQNVRDSIKEAYEAIEPQEANITAVYDQVVEYEGNLTIIYADVKSQITSDDFLDYLAQMKNMTDDSGYTNASIAIEEFINGIEAADESTTYDLQTNLVNAIDDVEFVYDCLLRKARAFANSAADCEAGTDTLENIYTDVVTSLGTNDGECITSTNVNYTTFEDVQAYVTTSAELNGYQIDCVLNNEDKKSVACGYYCDGYTASETAGHMSLSESQVEYFYGLCDVCPLTPSQINTICNLNAAGIFTYAQIAGYVDGVTEAQVQATVEGGKCWTHV